MDCYASRGHVVDIHRPSPLQPLLLVKQTPHQPKEWVYTLEVARISPLPCAYTPPVQQNLFLRHAMQVASRQDECLCGVDVRHLLCLQLVPAGVPHARNGHGYVRKPAQGVGLAAPAVSGS